jgi:trehalose 6-phosphate phosphatase
MDPHEHSRWEHVMRRLTVPLLDNGMLAQFEGYQQLEELDWAGYRDRYGNIQRLDRILEAEGDDINRYRASKQADVLMLLDLLPAGELADVLSQLGCPFEVTDIPHLIDYYLARTSHGSTLSSLVHAWVLARVHRHQAEQYLDEVLSADLADIQGGTTAEGIHLGAMAGSVDLIRRCFAGIEVHDDALLIDPSWPAELGTLELRQRYQGHSLAVSIRHDQLTISSRPGRQPPITVRHAGVDHLLAAADTLRIAL